MPEYEEKISSAELFFQIYVFGKSSSTFCPFAFLVLDDLLSTEMIIN